MAILKKLDVIVPNDSELVTLYQNVDCATGSTAINDEFHDMFISLNGRLIGPHGPGRYKLDTQSSPFFTSIRYLPTGGRAPINVSVFFVSKQNFTQQWGTGEFVCCEKIAGFPLPVRAAAGGTMIFRVSDSRLFLTTLVGLRGFNTDDMAASTQALIVPPVRDALTERMSSGNFAQSQINISSMSASVFQPLANSLSDFGLLLTHFSLICFNINESDLAKIQSHNEQRIKMATELEATKNELESLYNGNIYDKAKIEALINLSKASGETGGLSQLALFPMMISLGKEINEQLGDVFSASRSARPIPNVCSSCNRTYEGNFRFCPHCGQRII